MCKFGGQSYHYKKLVWQNYVGEVSRITVELQSVSVHCVPNFLKTTEK